MLVAVNHQEAVCSLEYMCQNQHDGDDDSGDYDVFKFIGSPTPVNSESGDGGRCKEHHNVSLIPFV